jgi:hypothetical protein
MAKKLDPKEIATSKELLMSEVIQSEALPIPPRIKEENLLQLTNNESNLLRKEIEKA